MMEVMATAMDAVADTQDGATVLVSGFGTAGQPVELIEALLDTGATDLTVVSNNAGNGDAGLAALIRDGRVQRMICSFPRQADSRHFDAKYRAGEVELEVVPQGNLAERIRAAGAGIGAFYTPTGYDTPLAEGKETRVISGKGYILEYPIRGDIALVKAHQADQVGNLIYRKTARNFGPIMAAAAETTVVQVDKVVPTGTLDPEHIVTPCIYVDRVVEISSLPTVVWELKQKFQGPVIANEDMSVQDAERLVGSGWADAVAFGRDYLSTPDLAERIAVGAAPNAADPSTFYFGGREGYTDYPRLQDL